MTVEMSWFGLYLFASVVYLIGVWVGRFCEWHKSRDITLLHIEGGTMYQNATEASTIEPFLLEMPNGQTRALTRRDVELS